MTKRPSRETGDGGGIDFQLPTLGRSALAVVLVLLTVTSAFAGAGMAAETTPDPDLDDAQEPDPAKDQVQNPYIEVPVTKSVHEAGWDALEYEDNTGDMATMDAAVNDSIDNPYNVVLTDVETAAYSEFPVNSGTEDATTAIDAGNWTTDASGTAGSVSVSDVETATGVDAVSVSTSSQTSGDTAKATFDEYKITSDVQKRYVQVALDVSTLDSGADVFIRFKDTDGDYVQLEIDPDDDPNVGNNITNASGEGYVAQRQVGEMTVAGSGDGTMDNINATTVVVNDANAEVRIAGLNVERTSPWTLGEMKKDTDGDDDLETVTITDVNETGGVDLHSLDSMGAIYDAATLHDVTFEAQFRAQDLSDGDKLANFTEAEDYQSYDWTGDTYYRLSLPDAYDLSYGTAELKGFVDLPAQRYLTVEYATGTGDTDLENVSGYTDVTSSYEPKDANVTLKSGGISAGENIVFHSNVLYTDAEKQDFWVDSGSSGDDGGAGGGLFASGGDGGILSSIFSPIGGMISAILAFIGLRKKRG